MVDNSEDSGKSVDFICVIDDDDIYKFTISRLLKLTQAAHKVMFFENGKEAMNYFVENSLNAENLPDIIFLDINMPVMDGWDFLKEYIPFKQKLPKKITIYMISSSVDQKDIERVKSFNEVSDYVIKPITREKVVELIEKSKLKGL